jgi:hypothetical protein
MPDRALLARYLDGWTGDRENADDSTAGAVVLERHAPGGLGEQRIILAQADVETRTEASSSLPY